MSKWNLKCTRTPRRNEMGKKQETEYVALFENKVRKFKENRVGKHLERKSLLKGTQHKIQMENEHKSMRKSYKKEQGENVGAEESVKS